MTARGILSYGAYLPYRRLDRAEIRAVAGTGGGKGTRTVASYDEDSTTLGVAARQALAAAPWACGRALWFATVSPAYLDKTNATAIHAALRLPDDAAAFDAVGAVRSALGALRAGLAGPGPRWWWRPTSAPGGRGRPTRERRRGGGAAGGLGCRRAAGSRGPWHCECHRGVPRPLAGAGREPLPPLGGALRRGSLRRARRPGVGRRPQGRGRPARAGRSGRHRRRPRTAATTLARGLGVGDRVVPGLDATVGFTGAAHPVCCWPTRSTAPQRAKSSCWWCWPTGPTSWCCGRPMPWPRPARPSAWPTRWRRAPRCPTARRWPGGATCRSSRRAGRAGRPSASAARSAAWKFGLVGTDERPLADIRGTIVTYTVDRLAYSPSPPVVFAVVDFDGGGRLPVELTDVDAADVAIGGRVEMTFRRLFTADGIHNYFWKARPVREGLREGSA